MHDGVNPSLVDARQGSSDSDPSVHSGLALGGKIDALDGDLTIPSKQTTEAENTRNNSAEIVLAASRDIANRISNESRVEDQV